MSQGTGGLAEFFPVLQTVEALEARYPQTGLTANDPEAGQRYTELKEAFDVKSREFRERVAGYQGAYATTCTVLDELDTDAAEVIHDHKGWWVAWREAVQTNHSNPVQAEVRVGFTVGLEFDINAISGLCRAYELTEAGALPSYIRNPMGLPSLREKAKVELTRRIARHAVRHPGMLSYRLLHTADEQKEVRQGSADAFGPATPGWKGSEGLFLDHPAMPAAPLVGMRFERSELELQTALAHLDVVTVVTQAIAVAHRQRNS